MHIEKSLVGYKHTHRHTHRKLLRDVTNLNGVFSWAELKCLNFVIYSMYLIYFQVSPSILKMCALLSLCCLQDYILKLMRQHL